MTPASFELRVGSAAMLEAASDQIEALICYAGVLVDELGVRSVVIVDTETQARVWPPPADAPT